MKKQNLSAQSCAANQAHFRSHSEPASVEVFLGCNRFRIKVASSRFPHVCFERLRFLLQFSIALRDKVGFKRKALGGSRGNSALQHEVSRLVHQRLCLKERLRSWPLVCFEGSGFRCVGVEGLGFRARSARQKKEEM